MTSREATHAGSWYSSQKSRLTDELKSWLDSVPGEHHAVEGARVIIAPHAGYTYSGETAAYAYKSLDLTGIKRVFLLGPSHHLYLPNAALSQCKTYETPFGDLVIDTEMIKELEATGAFTTMTRRQDEDEHSLEMHLPYIYAILHFSKDNESTPAPLLVPIMVGSTNVEKEKEYGKLLATYLAQKENLFVISSDFCHWGSRFSFTYYNKDNRRLTSSTPKATYANPPIHKAIETLDKEGMRLIESGDYRAFTNYLRDTGNTICGRHPIGVTMCALTELEKQGITGKWAFIKYAQSSHVEEIRESSVSYVSAYWAPNDV